MITVVTPISPIKSHPSVDILAETIESVRRHLPDAEIILTFDGVRAEQEHLREAYETHIYRALWLADHKWKNVCPFIFEKHTHQVGMLRGVINEITTPMLLYVEQDAPLTPDRIIDWPVITEMIAGGWSNHIRFHHESRIPDEHQAMMHGPDGIVFTRTSQWSQRPHVASVEFYRHVLNHFSPQANTFIEDKMHGALAQAFILRGNAGWEEYRTHIYTPPGDIKRSYHTDGRAGGPKYDTDLVF